MANVSYVYPNVSGITQRGGLLERCRLADELGCDYVEVPADFIKNKTEMKKTGLSLVDSITRDTIAELYERDSDVPQELKYILHTEPSLTRRDDYGVSFQAPLKWHDQDSKGWDSVFFIIRRVQSRSWLPMQSRQMPDMQCLRGLMKQLSTMPKQERNAFSSRVLLITCQNLRLFGPILPILK